MQSSLISLEAIEIASPCRADWDAMQGNQCVRFCPTCGKNVYNLSAMTREEAERLITRKEGTPCVRLRRRNDGTVLTDDCPVGSETRKRQRRGIELLVGALSFVVSLVGGHSIWGLRGLIVDHSTQASQKVPGKVEIATRLERPEQTEVRRNTPEHNLGVKNELGINAPGPTLSGPRNSEETTMGMPAFNPDLIPTPTPSSKHGEGTQRP